MSRRCETCVWWDLSTQHRDAQPDTSGACRVASPRLDRRSGHGIWPFTDQSDWCGSYLAREEEA